MKLIIDIDKEIYKSSKEECAENNSLIIDNFTLAIGNGTPIPKEHGDLIDSKDAIETLQIMFSKDKDIQSACEQCILDCPIIIEADKGE